MRVNIEREALEVPLIDLSQAFGMRIPAPRSTVADLAIEKRDDAEEIREETYTRGGAMTYPKTHEQRNDAEDLREETYTRGGAMTYPKILEQRNDAEGIREETYTRGGAMTYPKTLEDRDNDAEELREETYTRGGAMAYPKMLDQRDNSSEDIREETYTPSGAMTYPKTVDQRRDDVYSSLLDRNNLALGAVERINIAHRVLGKPEITMQEANETASHSDEYVDEYWQSSMKHVGFWTTDQPVGKPNFIKGGQSNGFGFTQSTYHKLHCLANLRMMLAWHITGNGDKMTRDMNLYAMHCLDYTRWRELTNPDLNEEPIDTVDYAVMAVNVNQAGFERRLTVVQQLLLDRGLQASNISTLAYDEEYEYPFNNFLFKVELATPAFASLFPGTQPGTYKAPPEGVNTLVIKLSNMAAHDVNNANRVANDVAAQYLVRRSMDDAGLAQLIPDVYAWAPATTTDKIDEKSFGWIMSEFRSGVDLGPEFPSLSLETQKYVLEQMAAVLAALQAVSLPEGVTTFGGGLKFDSNGYIVSGESPLMQDVKPTGLYAEWRIGKLYSRLRQAAESLVIQGWRSNGVATRIEKFLASGGPEKEAKKVTAVLDFDFATVSHPFEEFMSMSFSHTGGNVSDEDTAVNRAILSGDFTAKPLDLDEESAKEWDLSKMWSNVLQEGAVLGPSQIEGVNEIRDLMRLQNLLCPYRLSSASALEEPDDEMWAEMRQQAEVDLIRWLEEHGF
ncbi:hypothetical protein diail_7452 [Diaporthe ilicicola]|nr:hypothetical protein diail_7452 [Diaporthe ilicicola]